MRNWLILLVMVWLSFPFTGEAQEEWVEQMETTVTPDSTVQTVLSEAGAIRIDMKDTTALQPILSIQSEFKPDPNKALLYALVPGLGHIYNRKYWKLPIIYGAAMGCTYAVTWNNRNYQEYREAYVGIMSDTPMAEGHNSWQNFMESNYQGTAEDWANNESNKNKLKRGRDYFRRYRDLSLIVSAGLYLVSILDAYVDAQLFDFDISPDLSMRVEPAVMPKTSHTDSHAIGVNCSIKF